MTGTTESKPGYGADVYIKGVNVDTLEAVDVDTITTLDFEAELPCEGQEHQAGTSGHMAEMPGAYVVVPPCCGKRVVHCAPRVANMRCRDTLTCSPCGIEHDVGDYLFIRV